jgi:hypothetical protein
MSLMTGCISNPSPKLCPEWLRVVGDIKPEKNELLFRSTKEKIVAYRTGYEKHCKTSVEKAWGQEVSKQ